MSSIKRLDEAYEKSEMKNKVVAGMLYLVATPIGNLADMTYRAVKILSEVDFIAAEDTRNTSKLLAHYDIKKPLVSYFEHNKRERGEEICKRLTNGESCALVTDAGTPAISDPGEDLVKLCYEKNIPVTSLPGACAAVTALTLSGKSTSRFSFEGFLSTSKSERYERLEEIKNDRRTIIFYEAPHKLKGTLKDLFKVYGNRKITVIKEITKINEKALVTDVEGAMEYYAKNDPKGEYVIVMEGAKEEDITENSFWNDMTVSEHINYYEKLDYSKMDAIKAVAKDRRVAKSEIYKETIK